MQRLVADHFLETLGQTLSFSTVPSDLIHTPFNSNRIFMSNNRGLHLSQSVFRLKGDIFLSGVF